jgi:hypothetical protein
MADAPTTRARIWNLLRTARDVGRTGVHVATLAAVLGVAPAAVLVAVLPEMVETPEGETAPAIYCEPGTEGPTLCPRRYPAA